ncbi:hypothetical protein NW752_000055 [Fusarium irregulare]|uniref:Heterokaryon incompatibility domain-containing protein n=1 Tax=Fusarium irregulare TaxID=2494466 RepID=A0A9W8PYW3_9HYPO|nr:hypothetical protein NW766_001783 [Fusarium irregulare]KAJ4027810.1 hypothetical protein NW752_000055 [Fusarium irregulare]
MSVLAYNWIKNCQKSHARCKSRDSHFRPKRLIQILDSSNLQLVHPRELSMEDQVDYVALSHRWGGGSPLTLLEAKERDFQKHISAKDLPRTFQEAILACLKLGISYIWIDSLCIIQDSKEDWEEQAAEMGSVYGNCELNLCMAGSANPSEASFGSRDTDLILPVCIPLTGFDGSLAQLRLVCDSSFECDIKESPLRKRGWVFQEWYLSKRSLVLGRMQLWWHCREMLACETFPRGTEGTNFQNSLTDVESMKDTNYGRNVIFSQSLWWDLIKQYAGTGLAYEAKDRVIAFSGMPKMFRQAHQIQDEYVAGMWRRDLPQALLWYRFCGGKTSRSKEYKAPSWSWMSIDGPFELKDHSQRKGWSQETPVVTSHQCSTVTDVKVSLADKSNPFSMLHSGSITIHGHLVKLHKDRDGGIDMGTVSVRDLNHGEIRLDEEDENENSVISYLDPTSTSQHGVSSGLQRTKMSLKAATGSTYVLPLLHQVYDMSKHSTTNVVGLVLYESLDQPHVFYRIGSFHATSFGSSSFEEMTKNLEAEYPKTSIYIL